MCCIRPAIPSGRWISTRRRRSAVGPVRQEMAERFAQGHILVLFPEGTRATSNHLGEFKHGVSLLAMQHQVPVVPLLLGGLRELQPKGQREVVPGPASLRILEPMQFAADLPVEQATEMLYEAMNAAYLDMRGIAQERPTIAA